MSKCESRSVIDEESNPSERRKRMNGGKVVWWLDWKSWYILNRFGMTKGAEAESGRR